MTCPVCGMETDPETHEILLGEKYHPRCAITMLIDRVERLSFDNWMLRSNNDDLRRKLSGERCPESKQLSCRELDKLRRELAEYEAKEVFKARL